MTIGKECGLMGKSVDSWERVWTHGKECGLMGKSVDSWERVWTHMDRNRDTDQAEETPAGGRRGIQPAVSREDLDEFKDTEAARRLSRLEADTELVVRLSAEGFEGKAWREVSGALIDYGFQVMRAWVVTGQVFAKMAEKGRKVAPPPVAGIPRPDALVLAEDTVADAIVDFRDRVLKKARWDLAKGANLTTFFIGNCLLFQFPNLYRDWRKEYVRVGTTEESIQEDDQRDRPAIQLRSSDDPAAEVVDADHTTRVITDTLKPINDDTNKAILLLRAEGFGIDEIAETLDLDYDAVESRIYRARKKLGRRKGA